jgi:hypothetical protein
MDARRVDPTDATSAVNRLLGQLAAEKGRAVLVVEHALNERLLAGLEYRVLELRGRRLAGGERHAATREDCSAAERWTSPCLGHQPSETRRTVIAHLI